MKPSRMRTEKPRPPLTVKSLRRRLNKEEQIPLNHHKTNKTLHLLSAAFVALFVLLTVGYYVASGLWVVVQNEGIDHQEKPELASTVEDDFEALSDALLVMGSNDVEVTHGTGRSKGESHDSDVSGRNYYDMFYHGYDKITCIHAETNCGTADDMELEMIPRFIIGGAQKSGTTALSRLISLHPEVAANQSEIHVLSTDKLVNYGILPKGFKKKNIGGDFSSSLDRCAVLNKYHDIFQQRGQRKPENKGKIYFDETSSYMPDSTLVPQHMMCTMKQANLKLIFILRDPVARAYSHYHMGVRKGRYRGGGTSFENAIERNLRRLIARRRFLYEHRPQRTNQWTRSTMMNGS